MSGIFRTENVIRMTLIIGLLVLVGCSDGNGLIMLPAESVTRTIDHTSADLDFTPLDVQMYVPADTIMEGEVLQISVQLTPQNFPLRAYSSGTYERIGWLDIGTDIETGVMLQKDVIVTFPLQDNFNPNVNYSVFYFDKTAGKWVGTGRSATVTDDGLHAIFAANALGTWGVFDFIPLTVEAHAERTTIHAPASISLNALIDGGTPPYSVTWHYGDDSDPEGGLAVSHWYAIPQKYTATVIVVDAAMRQVSDSIDLNLY